jgi:threonine synthase
VISGRIFDSYKQFSSFLLGEESLIADVQGFYCLRCQRTYTEKNLFEGCPACAPDVPVNLVPVYDLEKARQTLRLSILSGRSSDMWRYQELLPVDSDQCVSLGEGMTKLLPSERLGRIIGIPKLYFKAEMLNPTGSFKDRLASAAISKAKQVGAKVIICSSTGNMGVATAAYAAKAGLDCVVLTTATSPSLMRSLMKAHGAMVLATREMRQRWTLMRTCVESLGWYPISNYCQPFVGSNPFGVDGYKTIGLEICEQLKWRTPDVIAVPSGFGEGLWGTWWGCWEAKHIGLIQSMPRMVAAEVFGPLSNALRCQAEKVEDVPVGNSVAYSVGTSIAAYQALFALRQSRGLAGVVSDAELLEMQWLLSRTEGILAETASVLPLALLKRLRFEGCISEDDLVVAVLTSAGSKDPSLLSSFNPDVPIVEPNLRELRKSLSETYDRLF